MRIGVLSRQSGLYSTSRLVEAARERGHEVSVVDYLRCYMDITSKRPRVRFAGRELEFDAIVPRIGATYTFYGTAVVRQFEVMHVLTANESQAIARARDKLRSLQLLSRAGVGLPVTGFAHSTKDIDGLLEVVGRPPYVIKLLEGTQGVGVVKTDTRNAAESVIAAFRQLDANILVQRYIAEADNTDLRAFVVGGKVVAAMERVAAEGEFRANLHRGGTARHADLTASEEETAISAAHALGLDVSGVDMLRSKAGPLVIEVNASPGLEGIETASGVDVAGEIIRFLEDRNPPPDS
ncbi:MAG: ribosomal protein S6 modification protein [Actinobacteria bacterium RBG_16_68_21]|nr:MAG: ribosomal protein S6 modification protein [Actinobacteria bacterium RBG_16_68_21]